MKIAIIFPKRTKATISQAKFINWHPLALTTIAALTSKKHELQVIDENFEEINYDKGLDLVTLSVMTPYSFQAYKIAKEFRKRGTTVVMGGYHPSAMPGEALKHADAVAVGEAELIWPKIVKDFENKKLKRIYKSEKLSDLCNLPIPRRDLIRNTSYKFFNNIQTSRGCPHNCDFCAVTSFFGKGYRYRPVKDIVSEIEDTLNKTKFPFIWFCDDNLVGHRKHAKELMKSLIPLKIRWSSAVPLDIANDDELLKIAAKSGFTMAYIGFESLSKKNLEDVNKGWNKPAEYRELIKKIRAYGIGILGLFLFGLDYDDNSVFKRTMEFLSKTRIDACQFTILTPFPGTRIFERFKREGRLLHTDWPKYDCGQVVFRPKMMTVEELEEGYLWMYKTYYSQHEIFKRLIRVRQNVLPSLIMNRGFRQIGKVVEKNILKD